MATAEVSFSRAAGDVPLEASTSSPELAKAGEFQARAREALSLWVRWNEVYQQVTAAMFDQRQNLEQLQQTMDLADELRRQAVRLTQELLEK
jgi:hypothetical protein